jgi:DMSO/TMAO reductase YedYZ molybdopterin-dependent catalytic subunit
VWYDYGMSLPPGQRAIDRFPRFGVPASAHRMPAAPAAGFELWLEAPGSMRAPIPIAEIARLPRREVVADFHCVTTWTFRNASWSGYSFREFYTSLVCPRAPEHAGCAFVELAGLDGYHTCVALEDLLVDDVLLADRLGGAPLSLAHGAPLRLVVPALYGYKNIKHVAGLKLRAEYRRPFAERQTHAHPRGRVRWEERGRGLPGPVYRVLYRALLPVTFWYYRRAEREAACRQVRP